MITSVKSRTWTEVRYLHQKYVSQLNEIICHLFYLDCLCRLLFLSSITVKTLTARAYEYHGGCLIRNMNCLPFASTPVFFWFFFGRSLCCSSFYLLFCLDLLCVLCPMFLCFWIAHSYLRLGFLVLFRFALCLVSNVSVFLDCPFLLAPRFSPTFI